MLLATENQFELWQVLVLAVVQGITEFLPVSSDGHLAIVEPLLFRGRAAPANSLGLTIVLHLGTLGSILVYYQRRIWRLVGEDRGVLGLIILGTLPAVAIVLLSKFLFDDQFEAWLKSPFLAGLFLPATGLALLFGVRHAGGQREYRDLRWPEALLIGAAQAAAILPGLSRSGSTIAAALGLGLKRPAAASFSFLLAIPALAGAGCYEGLSMIRHHTPLATSPANLLLGAAVSFAVGLVALRLLERVLVAGKLQYFAWYCIGLGILVALWHWPR
jgi:undecaprenyl-diphosphatase